MYGLIFFSICSYQSENALRDEDLVFAVLLVGLAAKIFLVYVCVSTQYWYCGERRDLQYFMLFFIFSVIIYFAVMGQNAQFFLAALTRWINIYIQPR